LTKAGTLKIAVNVDRLQKRYRPQWYICNSHFRLRGCMPFRFFVCISFSLRNIFCIAFSY